MRILLVDDDAEIRMLAGFVLQRAGHELESAGDGASGLAAARGGGFDLILLDYRLGDMTGAAVFDALKREPIGLPPVVFLTGDDDHETVSALLDAGAAGVIGKPFDPEALPAQVAAHAGGRA